MPLFGFFTKLKKDVEVSARQQFVLYEVNIDRVAVHFRDGSELTFEDLLRNGRANYILFEMLVRKFTGLKTTKGSDHEDDSGLKYEQKAYQDEALHPNGDDLFQVSPSSTFGANNHGPTIKKLLEAGKYNEALKICREKGYDKNAFYIVTNTRGFNPSIPLRFMIVPTSTILSNLDASDPRFVSRSALLKLKTKTVRIL